MANAVECAVLTAFLHYPSSAEDIGMLHLSNLRGAEVRL